MKKFLFVILFMFYSVNYVYSQVWESKEIVTFPRSGMIQDDKISDKIIAFDSYKGKCFTVCKSNGFVNLNETIEKNHIIYYDLINSDIQIIYEKYYTYDNKYIFNLYDFNVNSISFHKNSSDSLWITHYIADSTGSYFSKFNIAGGLLLTSRFDKIYMMDWKDNDNAILIGKGLYITSNSGYKWDTLVADISLEIPDYIVADSKLTDDYIYLIANHKTQNKSIMFRYKLNNDEFDGFEFSSDLTYNNIEIIDGEIYILGGKSRDILNPYSKFNIFKFNSVTENYEKILDMNSQSELTHLLKRNDTLRAFSSKDLFYAEYTQNGWKYHENLNNEVIARFNKNNFREEEVRISFDSIYVTNYDTVYLFSEEPTTGVINKPEQTISIIPNPAEEYIEISIDGAHLEGGLHLNIAIYDVLGNVVVNSVVSKSTSVPINRDTFAGGGQVKIDISHLPKGVYFVRIGERVEKFVKK